MSQLPDLRGERETWGRGAHIKTILERSTIDDLNLHYFISLFAAWNAIDTFFVFVIVLISHPAWAPAVPVIEHYGPQQDRELLP